MVQAKKRRSKAASDASTKRRDKNSKRRTKRVAVGRYRSGLEQDVALDLNKKGIVYGYESVVFRYTVPAQLHRYTPDFVLPNGIYVEVKGRLTFYDRRKYLAVAESNPGIDLRFLFHRPGNRISKVSETTYSKWAEDNGFLWAGGRAIPDEWLT